MVTYGLYQGLGRKWDAWPGIVRNVRVGKPVRLPRMPLAWRSLVGVVKGLRRSLQVIGPQPGRVLVHVRLRYRFVRVHALADKEAGLGGNAGSCYLFGWGVGDGADGGDWKSVSAVAASCVVTLPRTLLVRLCFILVHAPWHGRARAASVSWGWSQSPAPIGKGRRATGVRCVAVL